MQVSSKYNCPWCAYEYNYTSIAEDKQKPQITVICPKCSNSFQISVDTEGNILVSNQCEENALRHNWNYSHVPGYDLYKKCRRCKKVKFKLTQAKLRGFSNITT